MGALSVRLLALDQVTALATVISPASLPALPKPPVVTVTLAVLSAFCSVVTLITLVPVGVKVVVPPARMCPGRRRWRSRSSHCRDRAAGLPEERAKGALRSGEPYAPQLKARQKKRAGDFIACAPLPAISASALAETGAEAEIAFAHPTTSRNVAATARFPRSHPPCGRPAVAIVTVSACRRRAAALAVAADPGHRRHRFMLDAG